VQKHSCLTCQAELVLTEEQMRLHLEWYHVAMTISGYEELYSEALEREFAGYNDNHPERLCDKEEEEEEEDDKAKI
jgi:hypothetical protein